MQTSVGRDDNAGNQLREALAFARAPQRKAPSPWRAKTLAPPVFFLKNYFRFECLRLRSLCIPLFPRISLHCVRAQQRKRRLFSRAAAAFYTQKESFLTGASSKGRGKLETVPCLFGGRMAVAALAKRLLALKSLSWRLSLGRHAQGHLCA